MSLMLIAVVVAFVWALAHGMLVTAWRSAVEKSFGEPRPVPPYVELPSVRVIIPVRNGADTLNSVLQDLHAQHYPREQMEVVVVNDHSTDATRSILQAMGAQWHGLRAMDLPVDRSGKKAAIDLGLGQEGPELTIVTDADVRSGPDRVRTIVEHWQRTAADMLLAPVRTHVEGGLLAMLQGEEQAALQGATAGSALLGSPLLANGANMAFTRSAFRQLGGFHGDPWASGDDMTLLARMQRAQRRVVYVADPAATVVTGHEGTWSGYLQQRLRWAGKMRAHPEAQAKWLPVAGLLLPWVLLGITVPAMHLQVGERLLHTWTLLLFAWAAWALPVVRLVRTMHRALGTPTRPVPATILALAWFAAVSPAIALLSLLRKPLWKGRRVR